jgi:hypothetical protein
MDDRSDLATKETIRTVHGKEDHVVWDELAPSDDEEETGAESDEGDLGFSLRIDDRVSLGAQFESQLIQEDLIINQEREMGIPVTGLERVEDTRRMQASPRARVRKRLSKACEFALLIADSRFMEDRCLSNLLEGLLSLVPKGACSASTTDNPVGNGAGRVASGLPLSPASEALAEVLICELAVKNRDRFSMIWHNHLNSHYYYGLSQLSQTYVENPTELLMRMNGSIEKMVTGLLRLSRFSLKRGELANDVLFTWTILDSCEEDEKKMSLLDVLDHHIGEGVWRITRSIDETCLLAEKGWHGILSLIGWSLRRGASLPPLPPATIGRPAVTLAEDDPSLQAYRSLHFLLNVSEAKAQVPSVVGACIQVLVVTGDRRNCSKLSIAGLDLLQSLSNQIEGTAIAEEMSSNFTEESRGAFWRTNWLPVIESVASASRMSPNPVSMFQFPFLCECLYSCH